MDMKSEWLARVLVVGLVLAASAIVAGGRLLHPPGHLLHARLAENGGWSPESLKAVVGQPLNLRLTSDDVLHSFAVGQMELPAVDVIPGEITSVSLTFDQPGKYVYYCTRWCGANHWRMRGVIEVSGPAQETPAAAQALYLALGLDLDAPRTAAAPLPETKPSAVQGARLGVGLPAGLQTEQTYRTQSPAQVFAALKDTPALAELPDQKLWDLVALLWSRQTGVKALENGKALYAQNCAACHGAQGQGDGVFADELAQPSGEAHADMPAGEMTQPPAGFTDPAQMLSANSALLQGKIVRGGMGTGMPYWGPIFTGQQTWELVAYLWSFQFDLEVGE